MFLVGLNELETIGVSVLWGEVGGELSLNVLVWIGLFVLNSLGWAAWFVTVVACDALLSALELISLLNRYSSTMLQYYWLTF